MARIIESHGVRIPHCVDCKHRGEDDYCELMYVSCSFARQSRAKESCGPWANLFEAAHPGRVETNFA